MLSRRALPQTPRILLLTLILASIGLSYVVLTVSSPPSKAQSEGINAILISWDGVDREDLYLLLRRGELESLELLASEGVIVNITVTGHTTDTKAGHAQMLTGYGPDITGVYNNGRYRPIPDGYTIFERVRRYYGSEYIATAMITGKRENLDVEGNGPFSNAKEDLDIYIVRHANANQVGPEALKIIETYYTTRFLFFFHFSDPDHKGHRYGEGSEQYLQAIKTCDYWLGQIMLKLQSLGIGNETYIYVTSDHGFDKDARVHTHAPYVFLATNDRDVCRNGEQKDITPTILFRVGLNLKEIIPPLPGTPLQLPEPTGQYTVEVLANVTVGRVNRCLWANIGYDPIYMTTVADETQVFWGLAGNYGCFCYVRCHNLFSDSDYGCSIYSEDENGNPLYNWTRLDAVLDTWISAGFKPILECDFMPDLLAHGEITRNYGGGAINPPKDYEKWRNLIYNTVKHCVERYGVEEVRTWYWEIWNEPDLSQYFMGDQQSHEKLRERIETFNKMYDYFVDAVKSVDPQIKVGGPGIAWSTYFLESFLDHCVNGINYVTGEKGTEIDFISWHGYGDIEDMMRKNREMKRIIAKYPELSDCELHQNEWGLPRKDRISTVKALSNFEAVFLCRYIAGMLTDPEASVDLFLRWGRPAFTRGVWRPLIYVSSGSDYVELATFHAYVLLGMLGDEYIRFEGTSFTDPVYGFATRNKSAIQILIYHYDGDNWASEGEPVRVRLMVRGLRNWSAVSLVQYLISKHTCNPYEVWRRLGEPRNLTPAQLREIRSKSELKPIKIQEISVIGDEIVLEIELPVNSVSLLILGRD